MTQDTPSDHRPRTEDPLARLNEPFNRVFAAEIDGWIRELRGDAGPDIPNPRRPDPRNELVGLALSGGGMRSATYCLGVVQALARTGILGHVDYMSTVSGGGYLGAAITSLCAEELPYPGADDDEPTRLGTRGAPFPFGFPGPLRPEASRSSADVHGLESPATRHVREQAKMLAPRLGLFVAEVWTAFFRYLFRTALLWALYILPVLTAIALLMLVVNGVVWKFDVVYDRNYLWVFAIPALLLGVVAVLSLVGEPASRADRFSSPLVTRLQRGLLVAAAVAGVVVGSVVLLPWIIEFHRWGAAVLAASVGGGATTMAGFGGMKLLTGAAERSTAKIGPFLTASVFKVLFTIGGILALAVIAAAWYYVLWSHLRLDGGLLDISWPRWLGALLAAGALALVSLVGGRELLNYLSLHKLYERRIRTTWSIAATPDPPRPVPSPEEGWAEAWVRDDIKIRHLQPERPTSPYPLVCTALSIPGSTGPKLLDRKGESFVIAPLYTGSALTRWRPTQDLPVFPDMSLSTAATVSGAAVSPNMGMFTTTTLSILTTLANIRLGLWVPNPRHTADDRGPRNRLPAPALFWKEMFGIASHKDPSVYLADGGGFENLGLYELFRRRCKYIVAVDGTGEPPDQNAELNFGGLGIALRLARIDFGVEVGIDLAPLMRHADGKVRSHYVVGSIRYPRGSGHATGETTDEDSGILVFIKAGRVEPPTPSADLVHYRRQVNGDFPHDTTADQQFDQAQFESYRQLGFTAGKAVGDGSGDSERARDRFIALVETNRASGRGE